MGTFTYGQAAIETTFDDRMLAHLRAVIVTKLRRSEPFLFTWTSENDGAATQRSVWMHPAVAMSFDLESAAAAPLNREWLALLTEAANSGAGLSPHSEPGQAQTKRN